MTEDYLIESHIEIWEKYHKPIGITLAESKKDWLTMYDEDPEMLSEVNFEEGFFEAGQQEDRPAVELGGAEQERRVSTFRVGHVDPNRLKLLPS